MLQIILDTYFNVELDVPMRKPTEDFIMALMHFSVALAFCDKPHKVYDSAGK